MYSYPFLVKVKVIKTAVSLTSLAAVFYENSNLNCILANAMLRL